MTLATLKGSAPKLNLQRSQDSLCLNPDLHLVADAAAVSAGPLGKTQYGCTELTAVLCAPGCGCSSLRSTGLHLRRALDLVSSPCTACAVSSTPEPLCKADCCLILQGLPCRQVSAAASCCIVPCWCQSMCCCQSVCCKPFFMVALKRTQVRLLNASWCRARTACWPALSSRDYQYGQQHHFQLAGRYYCQQESHCTPPHAYLRMCRVPTAYICWQTDQEWAAPPHTTRQALQCLRQSPVVDRTPGHQPRQVCSSASSPSTGMCRAGAEAACRACRHLQHRLPGLWPLRGEGADVVMTLPTGIGARSRLWCAQDGMLIEVTVLSGAPAPGPTLTPSLAPSATST